MDARMPSVGEVLVHRYRRKKGEAHAEVLAVDPESLSVKVRMGAKEYPSLSAAAKVAAGGISQNGWAYWGLKKQIPQAQTR